MLLCITIVILCEYGRCTILQTSNRQLRSAVVLIDSVNIENMLSRRVWVPPSLHRVINSVIASMQFLSRVAMTHDIDVISVCPSVCLFVRHVVVLCPHHIVKLEFCTGDSTVVSRVNGNGKI